MADSIDDAPWNAYLKLTQAHRRRYFEATEREGESDFTAWATKRLDAAAEGASPALAPGPRDPVLEEALARVRYAFRSPDDRTAARAAVLVVGDILAAQPDLLVGFMRRPEPRPPSAPPRKTR